MMRRFLVMAALMLAAGGARAAGPLSLTLEGRVGPYVPDLDPYNGANALDTSQGLGGFNCEFGFAVRPMVLISPQVSVFDMFGTVTLGLETGLYTVRAHKILDNNLTPQNCQSGTRGLTVEELTVVPVMATATYRFDWALDKYEIPLVPYMRAGLGGAGFILTENGKPSQSKPTELKDSNGNTVMKDGDPVLVRRDPMGFSLGGKLAVGMMVALDFLEPLRALRARAKGVYKHSFVFVEVAGFDAGMYQNWIYSLAAEPLVQVDPRLANYIGPTLVVGSERLPLITGGLALTF